MFLFLDLLKERESNIADIHQIISNQQNSIDGMTNMDISKQIHEINFPDCKALPPYINNHWNCDEKINQI